jgi:hypothetical protein
MSKRKKSLAGYMACAGRDNWDFREILAANAFRHMVLQLLGCFRFALISHLRVNPPFRLALLSFEHLKRSHSREGGNPFWKLFETQRQAQWIPAVAGMTAFPKAVCTRQMTPVPERTVRDHRGAS